MEPRRLTTGYIPGASICAACAKKNDCTWPPEHRATFWDGMCEYCGEKPPLNFDDPDDIGGVCDTSDWSWPDKRIASGDLSAREL